MSILTSSITSGIKASTGCSFQISKLLASNVSQKESHLRDTSTCPFGEWLSKVKDESDENYKTLRSLHEFCHSSAANSFKSFQDEVSVAAFKETSNNLGFSLRAIQKLS